MIKATRLTTATLEQLIGGLSQPSKMPGYGWSISAKKCITGAKLRLIPGSVCAMCYALKGRYVFPQVRKALRRRLQRYNRAPHLWVDRMAELLNRRAKRTPHFRWFDSGDLQSVEMLRDIIRVAWQTPTVRHWLPTKEWKIVRRYIESGNHIPGNMVIRVSATMRGKRAQLASEHLEWGTAVQVSSVDAGVGYTCPAPNQGGQCGTCRVCWDRSVPNVDYAGH